MTIQKTFVRGNYTGIWSEDPDTELGKMVGEVHGTSEYKSGSLRILFKGVEEIVLHDKAERAAENVFATYVEPDWHSLADVAFDNYMKSGIPFSQSLKVIGEDERHTEHDVYLVKKILKDIFAREGFDEGDIEKELREMNE